MAELRCKQESVLEQPGPIECKAYGHVSKLTVSKSLLVMEGWWADTSGGLPEALAVRLRGRHCIAQAVLRVTRPEVMLTLVLPQDAYGYNARFRVAEYKGVHDELGLTVLAGTGSGASAASTRSAHQVRAPV